MAQKTHSIGAQLLYDADGTPPYTALTDVKKIMPPKPKVDPSETTHLESPGAWKEFIPGFLEAGEISFTIYFHKTQFALLFTTIFVARLTYYWQITTTLITGETNKSTLAFQGFVMGPEWDDIEDKAIMLDVSIQITGPITFTAGT